MNGPIRGAQPGLWSPSYRGYVGARLVWAEPSDNASSGVTAMVGAQTYLGCPSAVRKPMRLRVVVAGRGMAETVSFGYDGDRDLGDRLLAAVPRGEKTATSSLAVEYLTGEPLPRVGDLATLRRPAAHRAIRHVSQKVYPDHDSAACRTAPSDLHGVATTG